jgi:hypothetical protein
MHGMLDYTLSADKLDDLRAAHRSMRNKREADRIEAVVLLAIGWTAEDAAEAFLVEPNRVRSHLKCYCEGGIDILRANGTGVGRSACALDAQQLADLDAHLQENLYLSAKPLPIGSRRPTGCPTLKAA